MTSDGTNAKYSFSPILRMAAHAALTVIEKYYALTDDCEVYHTAISTLFPIL
jgi:hypothetical protein